MWDLGAVDIRQQTSGITILPVAVEALPARADDRYLVIPDAQAYSRADCISFVVRAQCGIRAACTFNQHLAQAGFTLVW